MLKLRKLIKEHTWDREFGDPLVTFEDVMEKHQVNKLKEDWWDNMDAAAQAQYIKSHPASKQAVQSQQDDDEGHVPTNAEIKQKIEDDGYRDDFDRDGNPTPEAYKNAKEKLIAQSKAKAEPEDDGGDEDDYDMGGDDRVPNQDFRSDPTDDDYSVYDDPELARIPDEEPSVEKSRFDGAHMDDVDDSLRSLKQQAKELSAADRQAGKGDIKPPPELERGVAKVIEKIESGTMTDEDLEWAKESYKELRGQAGGNQYLEDMEWDLREALKKHDSEWKAYARTGNELNQETLTIDGKQFRRISEGVEKQPKPKYAFSEFYQRFKRQE